jgi:predicted regulator of Ras-like GTPase activity (Roadblock/LC7/MglB family)
MWLLLRNTSDRIALIYRWFIQHVDSRSPSIAEGRMVDLKQTLSRFLSIPGVWQAILVGRDGLMIEGLTRDGKDDMEAVGAIMTTGLSTAEALGQEISRGSVIGVLMEYENGLVSVDPLGDFALLVTLSDNASNIARVRHLIKTSRNEILEALDIA